MTAAGSVNGREQRPPAALIVNADDWGRDARTTQCILDCVQCGAVTSVSAMVFMEGSEEGAALAREHAVDAGLHLNFTTPFTASRTPATLAERQRTLGRYLRRHRLAQILFNPLLAGTFRDVVAAQIDQYPAALRHRAAADRRASSHAPVCERPAGRVAPVRDRGAAEFFVSAG